MYSERGLCDKNGNLLYLCLLVTAQAFLVRGFSERFQWAYHNRPATWNTAYNVCRQNGGYLVNLNSRLKIGAVEHFKTTPIWKKNTVMYLHADGMKTFPFFRSHDNRLDDYWIGLLDSDIPNMAYKWSTCGSLDISKSNWKLGDPRRPRNRHCVSATAEEGLWRTRECYYKHPFICEKRLGNCTLETHAASAIGFPDRDLSYVNVQRRTDTLADCLNGCMKNSFEEKCFAVTFTHATTRCNQYFATDYVVALQATMAPSSGDTSVFKKCFDVAVNSSGVPHGLKDRSRYPKPCQQVHNVTSALPSTDVSTTQGVPTVSSTGTAPVTSAVSLMSPTYPGPEASSASSASSMSTVHDVTAIPETTESSSTTGETATNPSSLASTDANTTSVAGVTVPRGVSGSNHNSLSFQTSSVGFRRDSTETRGTAVPTDLISDEPTTKMCPCLCKNSLSEAEARLFIVTILGNLEVDTTSVSSYKRKFVSAHDDRPSAQRIGWVGAISLAVLFGGLVLFDLPRLMLHLKQMFTGLRHKLLAPDKRRQVQVTELSMVNS